MVEAEKYIKAKRNEDGSWSLSPDTSLQELIKMEAIKHGLPEDKIVEMIFAEGAALVWIQERGEKQLILRDLQNHEERPVKIFNFKEAKSSQ